ncbi:GNAT family N-acetyltransferase [Floccifex sp.]|uniref:GNAT family N-acetyltransferase n=1 Tax=Floccifex sp. TaxID=2815810 RepID=UPI003F030C82
MNTIKLIKPSIEHKDIVMDFQYEFIEANERISGSAGLEQAIHYEDWLNGNCIPHYGKVKEKIYLVFDGNELIGICDIRLETNEFINLYAGQIGYSVRPSQRKKGYASQILQFILKEAFQLGFSKILVTCNENNIASSKTIEKNGGIFESIIPHPGYPNVKRYYFMANSTENL